MKRVFYVSFIFSLFFIACNNDDDSSQDEQEVVENFYALKIGNNWKYEYFRRVGQSNDFETMDIIEEVLITETTIIDGEIYFVFQSTTTGNDNDFLDIPENGITQVNVRDSLGYLIEQQNFFHILFSNENFEDYLLSDNEWGDVYGVLKEEIENIEVEAGVFLCSQNEIYALLAPDGEISPGRSRYYYSDRVGLVFKEYSSVSNPEHRWEKRLIEFEILE